MSGFVRLLENHSLHLDFRVPSRGEEGHLSYVCKVLSQIDHCVQPHMTLDRIWAHPILYNGAVCSLHQLPTSDLPSGHIRSS
jgi:hypothetical protein